MALKLADLERSDQDLLVGIKGQMEANRTSRDAFIEAQNADDKAGMDHNKPGWLAFNQYAEQYRQEAARLGVSGEPTDDDIPQALTSPSPRDVGKVPAKPDKGVSPADLNPGGPPVEE